MRSQPEGALDHHAVRLEDPDFYLGDPHSIYERMRKEAPVFWYSPMDFWVVTRQKEIREVSKSLQFTSNFFAKLLIFK